MLIMLNNKIQSKLITIKLLGYNIISGLIKAPLDGRDLSSRF
jgi:hypothetical protein